MMHPRAADYFAISIQIPPGPPSSCSAAERAAKLLGAEAAFPVPLGEKAPSKEAQGRGSIGLSDLCAPAVGEDLATCHEAAFVGGKEECHRRSLLGAPDTTERYLRGKVLQQRILLSGFC